ncbi:MAG: efflux transporter outer membrane subunit [Thermodesulfobacteriota bacterium]
MASPVGLCSLVFSIFFLLSGCAVGPDFTRPSVNVSQNWLEGSDPRIKNEVAEYRNWWRVFNDPALDRLIDRAYGENLNLKIAAVRVLQARAQLGITVGNFFPQMQQAFGSLLYNRLSERAPQAVFTPNNLQYWQSEIGLQASWELDFWGKFRRAVESANASLLATVADYDNALVTLTADVANNYIRIRTLERRLEIARENVETQREILKIVEARFQYGNVSELDVEQAKTVLNNTLASVPVFESQLRQTKDALSVLLGLPPDNLEGFLKGPSEIPAAPLQAIVGIPADLLLRRPDVRSAQYQAAAQSAQIGVAKAELYPALSLTGNFGFLSSDVGRFNLSDMFLWKSRTYQFGPSLQWNILNYGRITNNVRVQDARFQQLLMTYQNVVLTAQQDVEDNLIAFLKGQDQAGFLAQSVEAAQKSLDLAVRQYRGGIVDFTTVLIAQQSLLSGQDSLATALGNLSASLVGVYRALGGGWEIREGKDLIPPEIKEEMAKRTNWGKLLRPSSYNPLPSEESKGSIRLPDW